jgi:hypothetical protein
MSDQEQRASIMRADRGTGDNFRVSIGGSVAEGGQVAAVSVGVDPAGAEYFRSRS